MSNTKRVTVGRDFFNLDGQENPLFSVLPGVSVDSALSNAHAFINTAVALTQIAAEETDNGENDKPDCRLLWAAYYLCQFTEAVLVAAMDAKPELTKKSFPD